MAQIASEALVERLADWGVDTVVGLPGDGLNGILEAFRRHLDRIKFVLVHHEEAAAFMATAHAKATGQLGVCLATSGPGGIHLLNGLYDAKLDHMPVLAITGMQETSVLGTGYQQEVHLDRLYEDVAVYDQMIYNPAQLPALVDIAVRTAYARRGVAHLTVPTDIQVAKAGENPYEEVGPARPPATAPIRLTAPGRPSPEDLQRLADVLNASTKPAILAGAGAWHAREDLLAVAEAGLPLGEYSPLEIKTSVAGYGRAEKQQVKLMVHSLLGLETELESEDACDAVAVAICHATHAAFRLQVAASK